MPAAAPTTVALPHSSHWYPNATTRPHPLFSGLIGAAIDRQRELRIPIDEHGLRRVDTDDGANDGIGRGDLEAREERGQG